MTARSPSSLKIILRIFPVDLAAHLEMIQQAVGERVQATLVGAIRVRTSMVRTPGQSYKCL